MYIGRHGGAIDDPQVARAAGSAALKMSLETPSAPCRVGALSPRTVAARRRSAMQYLGASSHRPHHQATGKWLVVFTMAERLGKARQALLSPISLRQEAAPDGTERSTQKCTAKSTKQNPNRHGDEAVTRSRDAQNRRGSRPRRDGAPAVELDVHAGRLSIRPGR